MPDEPVVRLITSKETWPLRHYVLRSGRPLSTCKWDGDDLPTTHHFGLFVDGRILAITSIYHRDCEQRCGADVWQLRGMAVHPERQHGGLGRMILEHVMAHCRDGLGGTHIWCNARSHVVDYYRRFGFNVASDEFNIEGIGPHVVMTCAL